MEINIPKYELNIPKTRVYEELSEEVYEEGGEE